MAKFITKMRKFFGSPIISVILSLLMFFQWYAGYAKEQSIKNNLLGIERTLSSYEKCSDNVVLKEFIYATLATIGSRPPFIDAVKEKLNYISQENIETANSEIRDR